jgi:hypothetical protein
MVGKKVGMMGTQMASMMVEMMDGWKEAKMVDWMDHVKGKLMVVK